MLVHTLTYLKMKILNKIVKWTVAIFILLSGLAFASKSLLGGILTIVASLLLLPPTFKFLSDKTKLNLSSKIRYGLICLLFIIGFILFGTSQNYKPPLEPVKTTEPSDTKSVITDTIMDTIYQKDTKKILSRAEQAEDFKTSCLSEWDGSCPVLVRYVKKNLNDPNSFEHVDTGFWNMRDHAMVIMKFRSRNGFGAVILTSIKAKISWDCEILAIIE